MSQKKLKQNEAKIKIKIFGMENIWQQPAIILHSQLILNSYRQLLGKELIERSNNPLEEAKQLFYAPMAVLSHNTDADPCYNYGNLQALQLWEMSWEELIITPSKSTTESTMRSQRSQFLTEAMKKGYITNCEGVRTSRTGKKYRIDHITLWNLIDEQNSYYGQAATFSEWQNIE